MGDELIVDPAIRAWIYDFIGGGISGCAGIIVGQVY